MEPTLGSGSLFSARIALLNPVNSSTDKNTLINLTLQKYSQDITDVLQG